MKRLFKALIAVMGVFAIFVVINNREVSAAYGRGPKFTVPKIYRGTWYSYDADSHFPFYDKKAKLVKITFTAHTLNKKVIYVQDRKIAYADSIVNNQKKAHIASKATKNWYAGDLRVKNFRGMDALEVDPWYGYEIWNFFVPKTEVINGKKHDVLWYSNVYSKYVNLYKSKAIAKKMKGHVFPGKKLI